ncbi:GPALPP motifs-containing protein 1-like [Antedon mediterranea]|uniref:GPALPP motifs-containing protein 1-like n=1 Tax=Antedon mediterranea TaxID=105859 RepID=UPI003AF59A15
MSEQIIGPSLPPGFGGGVCNDSPERFEDDNTNDEDTIGPVLPDVIRKSTPNEIEGTRQDEITSSTSIIKTSEPVNTVPSSDMSYGPALPPGFIATTNADSEDSGEDDEDIIGPMPATGLEVSRSSVASDIEARAEAMKNKLTGNIQEKVERETWMMELPDYGKNFGLGPRTFRKKAAPSKQDRSGWTETPADRERRKIEVQNKAASRAHPDSTTKQDAKEKLKEKSNRDLEIEDRISSYNSQKRGVSLVDMHQKDLKRKQEEEGKANERRPFNREVDLQVNRFDDAKKKRLIKESAKLNDKFSHGSDKVYL